MSTRQAAIKANKLISKSIGINVEEFENLSLNSDVAPKRVTRPRKGTSGPNAQVERLRKERSRHGYTVDSNKDREEPPGRNEVLPDIDELLAMSLEELENDDISKILIWDTVTEKKVRASKIFDLKKVYIDRKARIDSIVNWDFPEGNVEEDIVEFNRLHELSDVFVGYFLPKVVLENELVILIRNEDIDGFFQYVSYNLFSSKPVRDSSGNVVRWYCDDECFCHTSHIKGDNIKGQLNPLHIAAGLNLAKFLRAVLIDFSHHLLHLDPDCKRSCLDHFESVMRRWSMESSHPRRKPIDLAAEEDHMESVHVFLQHDFHREYLNRSYQSRNWDASGDTREIEWSFECKKPLYDTFLCKMAYHNRLQELDPIFIDRLMENTKNEILYQALQDAITTGAQESVNVILDKYAFLLEQKFFSEAERDRVGRIMNMRRQYTRDLPIGAMQLLCWTGNVKEFFATSKDSNRFFIRDQFGYTCLFHCLNFDDVNFMRALNMFEPVADREELFAVFHHLLLYKKFETARNLLRKVLAKQRLFIQRHGIDENYGLPDYITLPLEDVLFTTEDFEYFQTILEIYSSSKYHFNSKMMYEDVNNCLRLIQHWSSSILLSDQLRLALILMILPGAFVTSQDWQNHLRMNISRGREDKVAEFIMDTYTRVRQCEIMIRFTWLEAMAKAREIVSVWGGTTERIDEIWKLKDRNRKLDDTKPVVGSIAPKVLKSILKRRN